MKFPYVKTPTRDPRKKWLSRPLIPVALFGPRGSIYLDALIDSGADMPLFHSDIGRDIGLEIEEGKREIFSGIEGGSVVVYTCSIYLQIIGMSEKIEVEAGFTAASGVSAILGQEGFFDRFRIKFERDINSVKITAVKT